MYHYKKQSVKHMENTLLGLNVVKSVPLSVITVPPWGYAKHFVLHGYCNESEVGIKGKQYFVIQIHCEYGNIWFSLKQETQH